MPILGDRGELQFKITVTGTSEWDTKKLPSIYLNDIQASSNRIISRFPIYRDLFHSRLKKSLSQRERS